MKRRGDAAQHHLPAQASERRDAGGDDGRGNEPWVGANEVARHLNVTEYWVREMARCAEIPGVKIGAYWRFRLSDIDTAMVSRRTEKKTRRK